MVHDSHKKDQTDNDNCFNDTEIVAVIRFANALKRVHTRLLKEGYTFKDGTYIAPAVDGKSVSG